MTPSTCSSGSQGPSLPLLLLGCPGPQDQLREVMGWETGKFSLGTYRA